MKDIKSLTTQIDKARATLARLESEQQQAQEAIDAGDRHDAPLRTLEAERVRAKALALVLKRKPDTAKVDADIQQLEAERDAARAAATVSVAAMPIYEEGLQIARIELRNLEVERVSAVQAHIMAAHDAAQKRYLEAVTAMESAVVEMVGANVAWTKVFNAPDAPKFPGRGKQVLEDVRNTGVRVPWDYSRLKDPAIAAGYTENYRDYWYQPAWADVSQKDVGDTVAAGIVSELIAAGLPCSPYVGHAVKTERQVMVRIVRGSMHFETDLKRHPQTGEIISKRTVQYGPGDDLELTELEARRLVKNGTVAIHGEGALPPSREKIVQNLRGPRTDDGVLLVESQPQKHPWQPGRVIGNQHNFGR
ncbi:hypothetical protein ACQUFY_16775 [Robbsia andropogonis]|uniref:hypothetical protein n=1 Tax=Robbsia andropogonis TaxID=28092 RepID=UPI003D1CFBC5